MQILVLQSDKVNSSRSSSTSSGSAESFPPLRYTRYGSGEYDHLTGQENQVYIYIYVCVCVCVISKYDALIILSLIPLYKQHPYYKFNISQYTIPVEPSTIHIPHTQYIPIHIPHTQYIPIILFMFV